MDLVAYDVLVPLAWYNCSTFVQKLGWLALLFSSSFLKLGDFDSEWCLTRAIVCSYTEKLIINNLQWLFPYQGTSSGNDRALLVRLLENYWKDQISCQNDAGKAMHNPQGYYCGSIFNEKGRRTICQGFIILADWSGLQVSSFTWVCFQPVLLNRHFRGLWRKRRDKASCHFSVRSLPGFRKRGRWLVSWLSTRFSSWRIKRLVRSTRKSPWRIYNIPFCQARRLFSSLQWKY